MIHLYCTVCRYYDSTLAAEAQRFSNNFRPKFTDEECITIYLFGIAAGIFEVKAIYQFVKDYFPGWFPDLPAYQNFNRRINFLAPAFQKLYALLISEETADTGTRSHLLDSFPIIVANQKRSRIAKSAAGLCNKGYCASKSMYYYGVKLHVLGQKQPRTLPKPRIVSVTAASENDITVAKELLSETCNLDIFADKMYADAEWAKELALRGITISTPIKLKKGQQFLDARDSYLSSAISSVRQAIESFFNWINDKTRLQFASKVRSVHGLIAFVFARLAVLAFF